MMLFYPKFPPIAREEAMKKMERLSILQEQF